MHFGFIVKVLFLFDNLGMYRKFNPNPLNRSVGDCTVRAMCALFDTDWFTSYDALTAEGRILCDMPSANAVFGSYLYSKGFNKRLVYNIPTHIINVREFADTHPKGMYLLATGSHVVTVIDGDYYDSWDSGEEVPIYYWERS